MPTLLYVSPVLNAFGALLLYGIGCICLGLMLVLVLLTSVTLRREQRSNPPGPRDDGTMFLGTFLCTLAFAAAVLFFFLAARLSMGW